MTPSVPARRLPPPELPGHTWLRSLGSGGFADVHLYRQEQPAREVAVKVARSVGDQVEYAQIRHEADVMTSIAGHPAVVELYSIGTSPDGRPYLEMEFCPVANVAEQVRRMPLAVDRALDVVIRLCGGVEMLHRNGYVHRDIKPANVMFDSYSYPVLGDFGVAARIGALEKGSLDGFSVLWAPPEQHNRSTHAHPTQDVWALATTLWTFLSGRSPFEDPVGDNSAASVAARVYEGRIRGLSRPGAPKELERVLRHAMQLDPRKRTSSAAELGRQLQEIQTLMGRPVTKMELRDGNALSSFGGQTASGSSADSSASWNADQSDQFSGGAAQDEATRLRAMPSIDAERTRLRPSSVDLRPSSAPDYSFTSPAPTGGGAGGDVPASPASASGINAAQEGASGTASTQAGATELGDPSAANPQMGQVPAAEGGASEAFGAGYAPAPDSWRAPGHTTENTFDTSHPLGYLPDGRSSGPKRIIAIVALVILGMVVLGAVIVAMLTGGGKIVGVGDTTPTPSASVTASAQGEDPVSVPPPAVEQLVARVNGDNIQWSWTDPAAASSSAGRRRYVYTVSKPGQDDVVADTRQNAVSVKTVPGDVCIEVVSVAENGRSSQPTKACVKIGDDGQLIEQPTPSQSTQKSAQPSTPSSTKSSAH